MNDLISCEKISNDINLVLTNFIPNLITHIDKINNHVFYDFLLELTFKLDLKNYVVTIMQFLVKKVQTVNKISLNF